MTSPLHDLLTRDHERLDALAGAALRADGTIDEGSYEEFRRGLLWHIGVEETILFPVIRRRGGDLGLIERLHRDHAALAALLVPPPDAGILGSMQRILGEHNPIEEEQGGMYAIASDLMGDELIAMLDRIRATPPVRLAPHADSPIVRKTIDELLRARKK